MDEPMQSTAQLSPTIPIAQPDPIPPMANSKTEHPMTRTQGYILIVLIFISLLFSAYLQPLLTPPPRWEYKTVYFLASDYPRTGSGAFKASIVSPDEKELAKIGADGWEIVGSYLETETAYPNFGDDKYVTGIQPNIRPQRLVLLLKRRKH